MALTIAPNVRCAASRSASGSSAMAPWLCSGQLAEERAGDLHAAVAVAEDHLAPVGGVGLAAEVAGLGHPLDEVGDRRARQAHLFAELARGEARPAVLGDHHEQQGPKLVGGHVVLFGEGARDPVGLRGQRP